MSHVSHEQADEDVTAHMQTHEHVSSTKKKIYQRMFSVYKCYNKYC